MTHLGWDPADPACIRDWLSRVGRPVRPSAPQVDAIFRSTRSLPELWEALYCADLLPPGWEDGTARFVQSRGRDIDLRRDPVGPLPLDRRALQVLVADPKEVSRTEALIRQSREACYVWNERAWGAAYATRMFAEVREAPLWLTVKRSERESIMVDYLQYADIFIALRTCRRDITRQFDLWTREIEALAHESLVPFLNRSSVASVLAAHRAHRALAEAGAKIPHELFTGPTPYGGLHVADLPDPYAPLVALLEGGFLPLWKRDSALRPVLAATEARS